MWPFLSQWGRYTLTRLKNESKCNVPIDSLILGISKMLFSDSMKKTDEFRNVYENGKSYANKFIVVYVWKNGGSHNKIGISCSKKVGNSVVRHRFARLVREAYRLHEEIFNSGLDIVVVARACAGDADFFNIEESLLSLAGKARIIKNGGE